MNARSRPRQGAANDLAGGRITAQHTAAACTDDVATDASRRRDAIKLLLGSIAETTEKLADLIEAARDGEDHVVLGFASWTAYVAAEFSGLLTGLGTAERRVAVHALSVSGMPTRAIAEVAGVDHSTVVRDQKQVVQDAPPADRKVAGRDGKTYTAVQPERKPPRRSPLPDSYRRATWELRKSIERLEKLHADDRFQANRKELANNGGANLMVECSMRLAELARHSSSGADRHLGEYRPNGRAKYFGGA
jgi:hypothetical protein